MTWSVKVDGSWLHMRGRVSDLTDSTIFRTEGWSGDYQASCTFTRPLGGATVTLRRGMTFEVFEAGILTWGGLIDEVSTDGLISQITALGRGARTGDLPATTGTAVSYVPNAVVDYAESRGFGIARAGVDLGTAAVSADVTEVDTVAGVLDRRGATLGQYWWVDSLGRVTFRGPSTSPDWSLRPGEVYLGVADDEYASRLWGLYATTVNADGDVTATAMTFYADPNEAQIVAKFGPREPVVDLTALGRVFNATTAAAELETRFAKVGARMGWTNGFEATRFNLRAAARANGSPMSVRAGDRFLLPGVVDEGSTATYRPNVELVAGEVTRIHEEQRAQIKPVDMAPRGFAEALAAAQKPAELVTPA